MRFDEILLQKFSIHWTKNNTLHRLLSKQIVPTVQLVPGGVNFIGGPVYTCQKETLNTIAKTRTKLCGKREYWEKANN